MIQGKRFGLSAAQKSDVWCRWKAGQTLREIGRAFGKEHSSIRCLVSRYGGFVPAVRRRSLLAFTLREREEISRGIVSGSSIRAIAKGLARAVSTVSREVELRAAERGNSDAWNNLGSLYASKVPELMHRWGAAQECHEKARRLGLNVAEPHPPKSA